MRIMKLRIVLFVILSGLHLMSLWWAPESIAPVIAGTIYLPLYLFQSLGLPVFGLAPPGGWAAPSSLGWTLAIAVWLQTWWGIAWLFSALVSNMKLNLLD
jgi:hypothetical protein